MNKIKENFIYNILYHFFSLLTPILVTPFITRVIDQKTLGVNALVGVIASYFCMFGTLGMTYLGPRTIASETIENGNLKKCFWKLYTVQFANYFFVLVLYIIYCLFASSHHLLRILYLFELLAYMIDISWFFQGIEEFRYISKRNILVRIISTIFILMFVKNSNSINLYVIGLFLPQLFLNINLWITIFRKFKIKFEKVKFDIQLYKQMLVLAVPVIAISIYTVLDKTFLGIYRSKEEVAIYEQGQILLRIILSIVPAFCIVVMPRMASLFQLNNREQIKVILKKTTSFVWFISFGLMFGVIAVSDSFISWYLPNDYAYVAKELKICAPMIVIVAAENLLGFQILLPLKRDKEYTISVVAAALVNFMLNMFTIKRWGIFAACASSVVGETVALVIQIIYAKKIIPIKLIFRFCIYFLISGLIMIILMHYISEKICENFWGIVLSVIIGGFIYSFFSYFLIKIFNKNPHD